MNIVLSKQIILTFSFLFLITFSSLAQNNLEKEVANVIEEYNRYLNDLLDPKVDVRDKNHTYSTRTEKIFSPPVYVADDLYYNSLDGIKLKSYIDGLRRLRGYKVNVSLYSNSVTRVIPTGGSSINLKAYISKTVPKQGTITSTYEVTSLIEKKLVVSFILTEKKGIIKHIKIAQIDFFKDLDNDGVDDIFDWCPSSVIGDKVNENGCTDNDNDGLFGDAKKTNKDLYDLNDNDACVPFPNSDYCDFDKDGIINRDDKCRETIRQNRKNVNESGCTDNDGDGYFPDVPRSDKRFDKADSDECIPDKNTEKCDSDGDGVPNKIDKCPNTDKLKAGYTVDSNGCVDKDSDNYFPDAEKGSSTYDPNDNNKCKPNDEGRDCDSDGDGTPNRKDDCPDTYGTSKSGCPKLILPEPAGKDREPYDNKAISKWELGMNAGMTLPVNQFSSNTYYNLSQKNWNNASRPGFMDYGYSFDLFLNYNPTHFLGAGFNLGYLSNQFDSEAFSSNIKIFLADKDIPYQSVTTTTISSDQQFRFINPSVFLSLGYFKEGSPIGFSINPHFGILTDFAFDENNGFTTQIVLDNNNVENFDISFKPTSGTLIFTYGLGARLFYVINNQYAIGLNCKYVWANYSLTENTILINAQPEAILINDYKMQNYNLSLSVSRLLSNKRSSKFDRSKKYRK